MAETLFPSLEVLCDYVFEYLAVQGSYSKGYIQFSPLAPLDLEIGRYCRKLSLIGESAGTATETTIVQVLTNLGTTADELQVAMIDCHIVERQGTQEHQIQAEDFNKNPAWIAQLEAILEPLLAEMRQDPTYGQRLAGLESRLSASEWADLLAYLRVAFLGKSANITGGRLLTASLGGAELEIVRLEEDGQINIRFVINRQPIAADTLMVNRRLVEHIRQAFAAEHTKGRITMDRRRGAYVHERMQDREAQFGVIAQLKL